MNKLGTMEEPKQSAVKSSKPGVSTTEGKPPTQMVLTKMIEEKHTFTYKKLVVPMSMRSVYWKFFGFPATEDGDILTKVKIVCILCKTQIAYNRNTSNLRMHLQNKHNQELMELEASAPAKKPPQSLKDKKVQKKLLKAMNNHHIYTTNIDGTVQIDGDIQFVTDPTVSLSSLGEDVSEEDIGDEPVRVMLKEPSTSSTNVTYLVREEQSSIDEKAVSDAISEFIVMDLQLPEIVEGRGFQRLIATLRSPCEIPSKNKLEEEIIPKVYDTFRESVTSTIACNIGEIGLAVEEWRSNSGESFVTVSMFYQNSSEATLEVKVLSTVHASQDWGEGQWGGMVDAVVMDWELRIEKITAVVVGTMRNDLVAALTSRGLTVVPCLLSTLQVCAQACFETPEVAAILSKCRAIIGGIANNSAALATMSMQEQLLELEENLMSMDYPKIWTSTYTMLEQMIMRSNIITSIFETVEGFEQEAAELTNDQWKVMQDLVAVLEPFKVTIMTLSEEKMPLISLLKPLLWQLVSSHLKPKPTDSEIAKSFKESLSEMLVERYADPGVTLLLQIATTLDPRFKQLPYATEEDKTTSAEPIKEMLTKLIQQGKVEEPETKNLSPPNKKPRLSGMELLLGNLCSTKIGMPAKEKANLELVQYQSEPAAALDNCPLQWWSQMSAKCPNLSKLARRYHCVPACCAPSSRIPAEAQVLHDSRRSALPPHLVDKLLFLHGNHTA
ncbi:zinc finger BED domain-containing protein 1 [Diachasma alloeum]|uniref:zinc finger BED domain-containing protein 1 n=1 Tax=Diachasma alloeum TaxID=454923 RepID=UPI0007383ADC|nr:zinc finger BED domain-containing protein 1 [Diachasma alloeum]